MMLSFSNTVETGQSFRKSSSCRRGYERKTWKLPVDWTRVRTVRITNVSLENLTSQKTAEVKDGEVALTLAPGGDHCHAEELGSVNDDVTFLVNASEFGRADPGAPGPASYNVIIG